MGDSHMLIASRAFFIKGSWKKNILVMSPFVLPFPECIKNDQQESHHLWKCQYLNVLMLAILGHEWLRLPKWKYEEIAFNKHLLSARGSS